MRYFEVEEKPEQVHVHRGDARINNESLLGCFFDKKVGIVILVDWNDNNLHGSYKRVSKRLKINISNRSEVRRLNRRCLKGGKGHVLLTEV